MYTDRQTDRQTDRERERERDRETDRQTDRQTDIHTDLFCHPREGRGDLRPQALASTCSSLPPLDGPPVLSMLRVPVIFHIWGKTENRHTGRSCDALPCESSAHSRCGRVQPHRYRVIPPLCTRPPGALGDFPFRPDPNDAQRPRPGGIAQKW